MMRFGSAYRTGGRRFMARAKMYRPDEGGWNATAPDTARGARRVAAAVPVRGAGSHPWKSETYPPTVANERNLGPIRGFARVRLQPSGRNDPSGCRGLDVVSDPAAPTPSVRATASP